MHSLCYPPLACTFTDTPLCAHSTSVLTYGIYDVPGILLYNEGTCFSPVGYTVYVLPGMWLLLIILYQELAFFDRDVFLFSLSFSFDAPSIMLYQVLDFLRYSRVYGIRVTWLLFCTRNLFCWIGTLFFVRPFFVLYLWLHSTKRSCVM